MLCLLHQEHLSPECPWKDKMDLKFCTKCGFREHSLKDFLVMIKKIINNNNLNLLSGAPKNDVIKHKNLQIFTRQGAKISCDNK